MKVIVFGASGNCGKHFVRLAAARGHAVTAVVRATTRGAGSPAEVREGDVFDPGFVADAIAGHDHVVSALGMRYAHPFAKRRSPDDITARATANIVAGMKQHAVRRISAISAAGVGDSRPALNLPMRALLATSNVGVAYSDLERMETILRESDLEWQAVRPTTLTHGPATNAVRLTEHFGVTARIPREDVAAFLLEELEAPRFRAQTPMITVFPRQA
jgi:putative NADH-flavin reductase